MQIIHSPNAIETWNSQPKIAMAPETACDDDMGISIENSGQGPLLEDRIRCGCGALPVPGESRCYYCLGD